MSFSKARLALFGAGPGLAFLTAVSCPAETNEVVQLPNITIRAQQPQMAGTSVTILSGSRMRPGDIEDVGDLGGLAPNLTLFDVDNSRMPRFASRGLRENNFATGEAAVGLYVDGVPYTDVDSRGLPLYEVEQVEFLRGPQGTLYGAAASGGLISITTRQPNNDWRAQGGASYGNFNNQNYQAGFSGPLVKDRLFFGLDGIYSQRDGFVYNNTLNTHPDTQQLYGGRGTLRWTPSDLWDVTLTVSGERDNDGFVSTYLPGSDAGPFDVSRDYDGFVDTESILESLQAAYKGDDFKATSVTSHRTWRQNLQQDFDFSAAPGVIGFTRPNLEQWSEEVRVQSPEAADKLQWTTGFYFADKNLRSDSGSDYPSGIFIPSIPLFIPPPLSDETKATFCDQTYALYGQATVTVAQKLDLTGGLRLELDERKMDRNRVDGTGLFGGGTVNESDDFEAALPKVGAAYHLNDDHSLFFNVAEGFQSGGFNASNDNPSEAKYASSHSWNVEVGLNSAWLDGKLLTRAVMFYSYFENYQVYRFDQSNPTLAFLANAAQAHAWGGELEIEAHPTSNLQINLAFGATDARFDKFDDSVNGQNFDDKHINFIPDFTANLSVEYHLPSGFYARGEVRGVGDYYIDEGNSAKQDAYVLLNAQVGWKCKNVEIYAFGKNLSDQRYDNNALDLRSAQQPNLLVIEPGDPRMYGGAVTVRF